jgi:parallel beta-helix repeat protein/VCBS repeat-containing protein
MKHTLFFLIIIAFLIIIPSAFAETIYVGEGETYTSIQTAVDDASSGDTVIVKDGVYAERIDIEKSITLKSENGYTSTTLISPNAYGIIYIYSKKVIIDGFTMYGAHDSYAISFGSSYCIIRNNRIGLDDIHFNKIGIYLSSLNYTTISNNIFHSNTENNIYLYNTYYSTIVNNTFIGSQYAIKMNSYSDTNYIYRNSFINQLQSPLKSSRGSFNYNYFHSPFEITYNWNGSQYKSHIGNYYSDFPSSIIDTDENGIIDSFYSMPYSVPDDVYPLMSKAYEYKTISYFLHSNNDLSERLELTYQGKIDIAKESSSLWVSNIPFEKTTTFSGKDHWLGHLSFYSDFYQGDDIKIEIGYLTTGSDFVPILSKTVSLSSTSKNIPFYLDKQQLTIQSGHYLAFKITNLSNRNNSIYTGTSKTYITPPMSQASPPAIYEILPNKGSFDGGTKITIQGLNFGDQQGSVFFDETPANTIESWSYTQIVCTTPVHDSGFSTIRVVDNNQLTGQAFYKYYFQDDSLYVGIANHFQFIQQAIKYAQEGDTITVFPGIYSENLYINKTLHLQSKSGAESTTIVGKEDIVYVSAENSTIQGFTIYGTDTSSTGVSVNASNCKIIENHLGVTTEKVNNIGVDAGYNTLILNNIFTMNNSGINLDYRYCTIAGNTFFSNTKDIYASYGTNTICYNTFINNEERIESYQNVQNTWQSPIPIFYKYKGKAFINYMGNYYNNHDDSDTDMDGITDNNYLLPWTEPEDKFPLTDTIDQYSIFLFSLNSNSQINTFDEMQNENSVEFTYGGTRMWRMQTAEDLKQLLSQQTVVYGNISFKEIPEEGTKVRVYIGLTSGGSNFVPKGIADIVTDGKNKLFTYQMPTMAMAFESNKQLAFRIKNINVDSFQLLIGALKSCFSIVPLPIDHVALSVYPNQGSTNGGTEVFISGVNFGDTQGNSQILFGSTPVSNYTSWSSTAIVCQAPAHESGWVDVSIKRDGLLQPTQQARYLFKDETIYVGKSQMFSNIQQAVNHAQPFDTILVKSGEYQGNIYINKSVVLKSESGFASTTLFAEKSNFDVIKVYHENTTIDGFSIAGATESSAIRIEGDNTIIRNNRCGISTELKNNHGIYISANNNIIENNILSFNSNEGLFGGSSSNLISNNTSYKNRNGILITDFCSKNTVVSNNCHDNTNSGIDVGSSSYYISVLYNDCRNNKNGIKIYGSRKIIHANQCFFNKDSGIYSPSSQNIFSENICKSNETYGIELRNSNNILFLNQFQANGLDFIQNTYVSYQTNRWYSSVPLNYTYKGTLHFKDIGNYYDDHILWDPNNDGLVDEEYIVPIDDSGGDLYPLVATIDNYQANFLFLQPDGKISQNDTILTENIIIDSNESKFWQTFESSVSEIDFSQPQYISGQTYYSYNQILKKNDHLIVSIGYKDTSDSFVSITDPIIFTGDGETVRFDFQTTTKTIPSGLNGPLVIKIENPNDYYIYILTGSRWSFISMGAISGKIPEPENDEYMISSGGTLSIEAPGILENDFNPEDTQLTAILKNTTNYGSLTLNADGSFTYVHNGSLSATSDQFSYKVNNGYEDSIRTAQVSIQITHAPLISLSPNQNVTNSDMTITISGNAGSTIEYSLNDGGWQTYSEPIVVSNEGSYEITARLEDQNQEWLVSQPVSFVIDKSPPEQPILFSHSPQTDITEPVNKINVTWLKPDDRLSDIIGYSYLLDDNADSLPNNNIDTEVLSFTSPTLEYDTYYFHVCAVDTANNVSSPLHVGPFILGIIPPPVITLSPDQNITNSNMTITITGNAGSTIEYSLNDGNWQTYNKPIVVSNEGSYKITARLQGQNQEWLVSQPVSFVIDKTPPEPPKLLSNSPQTGITTTVNKIDVNWQTPDDLLSDVIGYSYLLDNDAYTFPDNTIDIKLNSFNIQSLERGKSYYFHICAIDSVNNVSAPLHVGPFIIIRDPNPPPPPKNLKVVKQMDETVKLEWDYINDYDGIVYHVYRSELSDGLYYRIDTGEHGFYSINNQKVYYTDKDLTNGQSYYYKAKSFWNNLQSEYSNKASAIPQQAFDFSCHTIDFDSQATWQVSKKVNVNGNVEYHFLIDGSDKFKGEIEASCNEMPDHVSYSFYFNKINYGASMHGITLPASFVLSITAGSATVPGEYQFELSLKNVWEDASSDFMDIPLMLTIKKEITTGIIMDISKQPEPSLYDIKRRSQANENEDIQRVRNQTTEIIKYRMNQNEAVEIYGEIFPPSDGKTITVQIESNNSNFNASTTISTNAEGKFSLANWLSEFDMNEYTLTASWTDKSSTTYISNPRTLIIEKGKPYLTCNSRSNITPQLYETFTISGAIHPKKPKTHVYLLVISPEKEMYNYDIVLDENGEYSKTHAFFDRRGIWKIKAYWFGDDTHIGCESSFLIVPVDTSAGRGIILGGGEANSHNAEFDLVKRLTTEAYKDFRSRGFSDDMIYYAINSQIIDITDDDIADNIVDNSLPSADSFLSAIENEFDNEVNEEIPLFIYMYGHGTDDGRFVVLGYDEVLEANQLDHAIGEIQNKTGCVVILILESCYSGKFIETVSGNNRIILTSTGDSLYKHDDSGDLTFSRLLFRQLIQNFSIKYSFDFTKNKMTLISYNPPLLDDNGDGISDQSDGALASSYYFKGSIIWNFNVTIDEDSIQMPYLVSNLKPVTVSAKVIRGDTATESVWVSIIPPDADLTGSDDLISFQKILLSYNSETQRYEGQLRYFCDAGLYKIVFMARQTNNTMSNPVVKYLTVEQSTVPIDIKDIDGNGTINIADAIAGLQVLSGFDIMICSDSELSFGLDDFLRLFQSIAE